MNLVGYDNPKPVFSYKEMETSKLVEQASVSIYFSSGKSFIPSKRLH